MRHRFWFSAASDLDDKIGQLQAEVEKQLQINQLFTQVSTEKQHREALDRTTNDQINNIKTSIDGFIRLDAVTAITDALNERLTAEESGLIDLSSNNRFITS